MRFIPLLLIVACVPKDVRLARSYEREGQRVAEAGVYLQLLQADPTDTRLQADVARTAPNAYAQLVDVAREDEASGHFDEALVAYDDAVAFVKTVEAAGALTFPVDDLAGERMHVQEELSHRHAKAGLDASSRGAWVLAVTEDRAALAYKPGDTTLDHQLAADLAQEAHAELDGRTYGVALQHFQEASTLDPQGDASAWAAAVQAAWGRYDLHEHACRDAVDRLGAAHALAVDTHLDDDLAAAKACARVEIVLDPVEDLSGTKTAGLAIGAVLGDQVAADLREKASTWVALVPATAPVTTATRWHVHGRITRDEREHPAPADAKRSATGAQLISCPAEHSTTWDAAHGFLCKQDVAVTWTEHTNRSTVNLGASLQIDVATPGAPADSRTVPLQSTATRDGGWSDGFAKADGTPVTITNALTADTVSLGAQADALLAPKAELPADNVLTDEAIKALSTQAAAAILQAVDRSPTAGAPAWLDVKAPITDPNDLQFKEPDPPRHEPRGGDAQTQGPTEEPI